MSIFSSKKNTGFYVVMSSLFCLSLGAAEYLVTSIDDTPTPGTLRYAMNLSNLSGGSNTIVFSLPANQTITLSAPLPFIYQSVAIDGSGAPNLTIDGNTNQYQPFAILGTNVITCSISNLKMTNCLALGGNGGDALASVTGDGGGGGGGGGEFWCRWCCSH